MTATRLALPLMAAMILAAGSAFAAPPDGTDPNSPTAQWFRGLVRGDGIECCAESDCRPAAAGELIEKDDGLDILINGEEQKVPESKIVRRDENPVGRSIVCRTRSAQSSILYCVVPYSGL